MENIIKLERSLIAPFLVHIDKYLLTHNEYNEHEIMRLRCKIKEIIAEQDEIKEKKEIKEGKLKQINLL